MYSNADKTSRTCAVCEEDQDQESLIIASKSLIKFSELFLSKLVKREEDPIIVSCRIYIYIYIYI